MLYLLIKRIYVCGYYYFFPFLVFLFNYYFGTHCTQIEQIDFSSSLGTGEVKKSMLCQTNMNISFLWDATQKSLFP